MRRFILAFGLLAALVAVASPAAAATTADFQANCTNNGNGTISCVFDATRQSSNGPGTHCNNGLPPTSYFWDFDDADGDGPDSDDYLSTTSSFVSKVYLRGPSYEVSLAVFCSDNTSNTVTHCFPTTFGFNGCIRPIGSWTP